MRKREGLYWGFRGVLAILMFVVVVSYATSVIAEVDPMTIKNDTDEPIKVHIKGDGKDETITVKPGEQKKWPADGSKISADKVQIWAEGEDTKRKWTIHKSDGLKLDGPVNVNFKCSHDGGGKIQYDDCTTTDLKLCMNIETDCGKVQLKGNQDFDSLLCEELRDDKALAGTIRDAVNDACDVIGGSSSTPITLLSRDDATAAGQKITTQGWHNGGKNEMVVVVDPGECTTGITDVAAHEYTHALFYEQVAEGRPQGNTGRAINEGLAWYVGSTSMGETDEDIIKGLTADDANKTFEQTGEDYGNGTGQNRLKAMGLFLKEKAKENGKDIKDFTAALEKQKQSGKTMSKENFEKALSEGLGIDSVDKLNDEWKKWAKEKTS